jgi:hypothetical protein
MQGAMPVVVCSVNYSKPYLGLVETGKRAVTLDIVIAYEQELDG